MIHRKKSLILSAAIVFCALFLLSGCSKPKEHEVITIMDAQRDYSALIELVHEKYPEINIEIVPYRGRNMSAYAKQQLETGSMPDIYSSTQAWDAELQKDHLVDLSKYAVAESYSLARLNEYIADGGLYLLPFDYSISGITYNRTLLERYGIEVPSSFTQLRNETIPALKANGINVCDCLLDLPGTGFQYFFNVSSTQYMNSLEGRDWRKAFTDTDSETFAADNAEVAACADYFRQWIDCGMINADLLRESSSALLDDFTEGNTAFLIGSVVRFAQNTDGTGDQYGLMPYLSEDGSQNMYITQPGRLYGLNKELEKPGNEQKLEDALHFLEVLSSTEGYMAVNGEKSSNMCSVKDFEVSEDSFYAEAVHSVSRGHSMNMVYTGWEDYLVPFGEAVFDWIRGSGSADKAFEILDETKRSIQTSGTTYYATVTEELDTVQAAQLSGQMFMEATGADAALISYNVYSPDVPALMGNSFGANGRILKGRMSEENITIFLPTGWYDTLRTAELDGSRIKKLATEGCDTRGTGFYFPYVLLTADGKMPEDDKIYKVVLCGLSKSEEETMNITDTGIVGLDAAKEYLLNAGEISSETLNASLVQKVTPEAKR